MFKSSAKLNHSINYDRLNHFFKIFSQFLTDGGEATEAVIIPRNKSCPSIIGRVRILKYIFFVFFCWMIFKYFKFKFRLHTFPPTLTFRPSEMTESSSQQTFAGDHPNTLQLIDRNASTNRQYQRTLTTTIVTMNDDEFVTTPTKRPRGNSVLEESLLNAGNYIRRKFSYGSSD